MRIATMPAREGKDTMPDGAITVKDDYAADKTTLAAITTMYRVKGYDPAGKDWFRVKHAQDRKIMAEGKIASCIDCHKNAKDHRFVTHPENMKED
jgi:hypothetical protein